MLKNINTYNQGNGTVNLLQQQQNYKSARSSLDRVYASGSIGKKDTGPVYIENKQFFYDLAFVPAHKQVTPVDKEIINESVYGKNWRQKIVNKTLHSPQSLNQSQVMDSRHIRKDSSIDGRLDESSQMSIQMPHIDMPKKRKNLNEVASLYISSEDEDDELSNQFEGPSTFGARSMMSNYSSKFENMKLNLLTRFRQSKGLHSPQNNTTTGFNKKGSIQHQEFQIENDYSFQQETLSTNNDFKFQVRQRKQLNFSQRVSEQAVFDYYRNYKNLKASIERDEHLIFPQSAYIQSCEKSNLIPRPYGLVTYKGDDQELNVKNFLMGNKYAKAYGQGLSLLETKKVNVSNNRLNERGTMSVLRGLNKKAVEDVDLSSNKVGLEGIKYIGDMLLQNHENFNLRVLKLEQTQISDFSLIELISALDQASEQNKHQLQELNLACNLITCVGAERIAQYIGKNPVSLRVLNLHWNKIKVKGGLKIAEALQNNSNLRVLDMSWNALGKTNVSFAGQLTIGEVKKKLKGQGSFLNQQEAIQQLSDIERQEIEVIIGKAWGKALGYNKYLIHLDLSYNSFGVDSCRIMQKKIKKNHSLYGLHLAGNACQVDTHGFIILAEDNKVIEQPEQSLNATGQIDIKKLQKPQSKSQSRQQKQRSYKKSTQEVNSIKSPQKEVLFKRMEGVQAVIKKRNMSIGVQSPNGTSRQMGNGNKSSFGYQTEKYNQNDLQKQTIMHQSMTSISQPGSSLQKYKVKDNCWICEGWSEFKFDLRVPQHIGVEVYLHFDFDDYKPDLMPPTSAGMYQTWRMVPPGTHHYFMSVNGSEYFTSGSNITLIDESQLTQIDRKLQKTFSDKYQRTFNLSKLNYVESLFQQDHSIAITPRDLQTQSALRNGSPAPGGRNHTPLRNNSQYAVSSMKSHRDQGLSSIQETQRDKSPIKLNSQLAVASLSNTAESYNISRIKNCVPRPDKKFLTTKQERPRTPWSFPISLFKEYKPETPSLVNECFEFDWQCLRKPKLKKSTEEEMKEKCREIYPFIREIYKRLAALGIVGTVFSIGWNVYREFMIQTLNITDKEKLKPDDCDRLFIGVNAGNQRKAAFIPEKALVRFQFLEILMKAAIKRYFESGDVESELEAIDILESSHLRPIKDGSDSSLQMMMRYNYNQQRWRQERFWNEPCDNILKAFAPLFTYIYNTFGGSHKKPGQKTFMTLDEFDGLIQTSGLVNDMMNQRDIALHWNFAMMCQVNEIDYERHFQATYIEFLEAFSRVCDQASVVIYQTQSNDKKSIGAAGAATQDPNDQQQPDLNSTIVSNPGGGNQDSFMTEEERQSLPLHIKIENAIQYLLKNCCSAKGFLDKFEMPKKHPQVGLYILPNKKFF
eukprot:403349792